MKRGYHLMVEYYGEGGNMSSKYLKRVTKKKMYFGGNANKLVIGRLTTAGRYGIRAYNEIMQALKGTGTHFVVLILKDYTEEVLKWDSDVLGYERITLWDNDETGSKTGN